MPQEGGELKGEGVSARESPKTENGGTGREGGAEGGWGRTRTGQGQGFGVAAKKRLTARGGLKKGARRWGLTKRSPKSEAKTAPTAATPFPPPAAIRSRPPQSPAPARARRHQSPNAHPTRPGTHARRFWGSPAREALTLLPALLGHTAAIKTMAAPARFNRAIARPSAGGRVSPLRLGCPAYAASRVGFACPL